MREFNRQATLLSLLLPIVVQHAACGLAMPCISKLDGVVLTAFNKPIPSWNELARINGFCAADTCVPSAYFTKAKALLERVVTRQEGWLYFGYSNRGGFNSLEQFRRAGGFSIIPVVYMPVEQFQQYQPGENLMRYCQWDTLQFYALAYKRRKPIGHLRFRTDPDTTCVTFSCGSVDGLRLEQYAHMYSRRLFLNETLGAYCVLTNGTLRVLNLRTEALQSVEAWIEEQGGADAVKKRIHDYYTEG